MTCVDCARGACRWWCPLCLTHHPVTNMVTWCLEHKGQA